MEKNVQVKIIQIESTKDLPLPTYMTEQSVGMDLYAAVNETVIMKPNEIKLIPTGIKIGIPVGYEMQIRARSGLALKHGIGMPNGPGTIDTDYRGEINVILINWGNEEFAINRGDRIAQMILNKVEKINWEVVQELDNTGRGMEGFGSTGIHL